MQVSKLSLKSKLLAMNGLMAFFLLLVGGMGLYGLHQVSAAYDKVASLQLPSIQLAARMQAESIEVSRLYLQLTLPGLSSENYGKTRAELEKSIADYDEADKQYNDVPFIEGEKERYDAQHTIWQQMEAAVHKFVSLHFSNNGASKAQALEMINSELPKLRAAHSKAMKELIDFHKNASLKNTEVAVRSRLRTEWISGLGAGLGFILSLVLGFLFSTHLSKALQEIANRISGGSEEVAAATRQISNSSEELSAAATEQAASLEETSASIEEMTAMVAKNSENANNSRQSAQVGVDTASEGKKIVGEMIESMDRIGKSNDDIMTQIDSSNQQLGKIVEVIQSIGEKTKVINDIVFQTKLLSFNASVEAARAGEHGKGFAVVAEEVGNLATMSGKAASEISAMLGESIQQVQNTVNDTKSKVEKLMSLGKTEVTHGSEIAHKCGEILEQIVQKVEGINNMAGEIATASNEQSTGIAEINKAMSQLDQVTQQNATASQQTASATEELSAQTEMLRSTVGQLMSLVQGGSETALPSPVRQVKSVSKASSGENVKASNSEADKPVAQTESLARVIPMRSKEPKASASSRVAEAGSSSPALKKAVGGNVVPPASDDPRFTDV